MGNKGHSERGMFGNINHYDENGKKVGESRPGMFGGYVNYDNNGNKTGHSDPGMFGGYNHYDNNGKKTGSSSPGVFGGYVNYDNNGKKTSESSPNMTGGYSHSEGCYVATCVYGSYDCPEVWTLRRFRDNTLGSTWYGRTFIRLYYAISPTLVKWFGKTKWFKKMWKEKLDRMVEKLNNKGVQCTPYNDKQWRK